MIDTIALFKAKQELNAFLEAHPHLKPIQRELDQVLSTAPDRIAAINYLIGENLKSLKQQHLLLKAILQAKIQSSPIN